MSKHTPGPFRVVEHSWSDTSIYGGGRRIALLSIDGEATEDTQTEMELGMRADAHLLAAAPELLIALVVCKQELAEMIRKHNAQNSEDGSWQYDYQTVCEADAAIAKATGVPHDQA